jgi:hypothetical protein
MYVSLIGSDQQRVREIGKEVEKEIMGNMVTEAEVLQQKKEAGVVGGATEAASSPSSSDESKKRQEKHKKGIEHICTIAAVHRLTGRSRSNHLASHSTPR